MSKKSKKEVRKNFRESVFKRDGYKCAWCGNGPFEYEPETELDAHHITDRSDMPNGGYVPENGISLCKNPRGLVMVDGDDGLSDVEIHSESCHMKAEKFHISDGKEWNPGMHPNDLYKLINSSYEEAVAASKRLK